MRVTELTFEGFRNLHPGRWNPDEGVNILYGDNAQGKTNLLEACWLFTGGRSFRGAKDAEMVAFGADAAKLTLAFEAGGREQDASITIRQRRSVSLNGVSLTSASKLAGTFCGVVFSPTHLSLIKDGPDERRRFIDSACCQLKPTYVATLTEYQKALTQRNAFLKQCRESGIFGAQENDLLDVWDTTLAVAAARLTAVRRRYVERLQPIARQVYDGLSRGREFFSLAWETPVVGATLAEMAEEWLTALRQARRADLAVGYATVGPHRDDLAVLVDGQPARVYGSQGQQRSAVLALKLAEAALLEQVTGEPPVAFLDDVMSELDVFRQDYILNHIRDWQVFITACEPSAALRMKAGKAFQIKQGVIIE